MKTNKTLRLTLLGLLTWIVPFVVSFIFYDRTGNLNVSYGLFKCVMVVVSSFIGMYALAYHLRYISSKLFREAVIAGLTWFFINIFLDIIILIPMSGMSYGQYLTTIGIGYLQIPVIVLL